MAEKNLSLEELDRVGLKDIDITWDNEQKLTAMFEYFIRCNQPLPSNRVNDLGVAEPNLSELARLAKVKQGKQVFRRQYADILLSKARNKVDVENPKKASEDETTAVVREKMQDTVDAARRERSQTDKKLNDALDQVSLLKAENNNLQATIKDLKQQLNALNDQLTREKKRVYQIHAHEKIEMRRA